MQGRKYWVFILAIAILATLFFCLGQAVTAKEPLLTGNIKNAAQIALISGTGAVNEPPMAKSLTPDNASPQLAGTTIAWTSTAYDPDGDKILYQFWLNGPSTGNIWKPMTNWSEDNVWKWTASPLDSGNNIIDVSIRDGHHAPPWGKDSHLSAEYVIGNIINAVDSQEANNKPSIIDLRSDRQSPQDQSVKITWTTKASDPDGDTILYQYWLKGPSTEEQWTPMTTWTMNNVWMWNTAQSKAGIYTIEVRIRDGYHADAESSDNFRRTVYIIKQTGLIK